MSNHFVLYPVERLRKLRASKVKIGKVNAILGLRHVADKDLDQAIAGSGIVLTAVRKGKVYRLSHDAVLNKVLKEREKWTSS